MRLAITYLDLKFEIFPFVWYINFRPTTTIRVMTSIQPKSTKGTYSNNRLELRNLWPPNRFAASKTLSNAMTGLIITKYQELIKFFIKNFTQMSLKLEKPEKNPDFFLVLLFFYFSALLESLRHAYGYQYAKIYLVHPVHDRFTL